MGIALGVGNYSLGIWNSLGQSLVLQVIISFLIGYPLMVVGINADNWLPESRSTFQRFAGLVILFGIIGFIGSEGQLLANHLLFDQQGYLPLQAGGVYLFNGILTVVLGFMTLNWAIPKMDLPTTSPGAEALLPQEEMLVKIPLRKGETTTFKLLDDVTYFEAYDNYSFLHDTKGERSLCNYALAQLEPRLEGRFVRVHRKYLINKDKISSITPHFKGRFVISFTNTAGSTLTSGSSYSEVVKELMRL